MSFGALRDTCLPFMVIATSPPNVTFGPCGDGLIERPVTLKRPLGDKVRPSAHQAEPCPCGGGTGWTAASPGTRRHLRKPFVLTAFTTPPYLARGAGGHALGAGVAVASGPLIRNAWADARQRGRKGHFLAGAVWAATASCSRLHRCVPQMVLIFGTSPPQSDVRPVRDRVDPYLVQTSIKLANKIGKASKQGASCGDRSHSSRASNTRGRTAQTVERSDPKTFARRIVLVTISVRRAIEGCPNRSRPLPDPDLDTQERARPVQGRRALKRSIGSASPSP